MLEGKKREAENLLKQMLGANETGTAREGHYLEERDTGAAGQQDLKGRASSPYQKYANQTSYRRFSVQAAG